MKRMFQIVERIIRIIVPLFYHWIHPLFSDNYAVFKKKNKYKCDPDVIITKLNLLASCRTQLAAI